MDWEDLKHLQGTAGLTSYYLYASYFNWFVRRSLAGLATCKWTQAWLSFHLIFLWTNNRSEYGIEILQDDHVELKFDVTCPDFCPDLTSGTKLRCDGREITYYTIFQSQGWRTEKKKKKTFKGVKIIPSRLPAVLNHSIVVNNESMWFNLFFE